MDILILLIMILICMLSIIGIDYMFQKLGLKIMFIIMFILSLVMSFKQITLGNITISLNIIPHVSLLMLIYVFITKYNIKDDIKDIKIIGIFTLFIYLILGILVMYMESVNDIVSSSLNTFVKDNYISLLLFPVITIISIYGTYKLYHIIKDKENLLFIIITLTSVIIGLIDSVVYGTIINLSTMSITMALKIGLGNYIFRIILPIMYIPVIKYVVKRKKELS